jgi:PAS domain S-box-containing protein
VRARQQEAVVAIGQLALTADDLDTLLDEAARRVRTATGADFTKILELSPDASTLRLRAGAGWPPGVVGRATVSAGADGQAGFALLAGEPIIVHDLRADKRFPGSELLRAHGVVSGLDVAIPGHARPWGVLGVQTTATREFTTQDVQFLRSVANVLAAAVRNQHAAGALRDSEARTRAILDTAVDGVVTIDQRGIIESVNPAVERLFGYRRDELLGRNVSVLMPEPFRSEHDAYIDRYRQTGKPRIIGIGREVVGRRKDGTTFPIDLAVSEFVHDGRLMFAGLLHDVTERRRMERQILEATAEEQRRIGQDLHDGLCQELAGIAFTVEVLGRKLEARGAAEKPTLDRVAELVDQAITHARELARGLQPVALDGPGLATALSELARKAEALFHVTCIFEQQGDLGAAVSDGETASHLYRIAQEAISNAVRHGKAHTIDVELAAEPGSLRLTVCDDGTGIPAEPRPSGGIGLQTMAYRARVVGGTLTVRPGARRGTVVTCTVPLAPPPPPAPAGAPATRKELRTHVDTKAPPRRGRTRTEPGAPNPARTPGQPGRRPGARGAQERARGRRPPDRP